MTAEWQGVVVVLGVFAAGLNEAPATLLPAWDRPAAVSSASEESMPGERGGEKGGGE